MSSLKKRNIKEFLQHINWSLQQLILIAVGVFGIIVGMHNFGIWIDVISNSPGDPSTSGISARMFLAFAIGMGCLFYYAHRQKKYLDTNKPEDD